MEQRQQYTTSQFFEISHSHPRCGLTAEQSCLHMGAGALNGFTGRRVAPENGCSVYPRENMPMRGRYSASQCDMAIRPFEHSSSSVFGGQIVPASLTSPFYNSLPYFPPAGSSFLAPENNSAHPSFGYPNWHNVHEAERGLHDRTMDTGRGTSKRKRFEISLGYERGGTGRYDNAGSSSNSLGYEGGSNQNNDAGSSSNSLGYERGSNQNNDAGSSSNFLGYGRGSKNRYVNTGSSSNSLEFWQNEPAFGYQNYPSSFVALPHYRGSNVPIHNEDPSRNVRRRYRLDWEVDPSTDVRSWEVSLRRIYSTNNLLRYHDLTAQNCSRHVAWLNSDGSTHDLNHVAILSAMHGRFQNSGSSGLRPEINQYSAIGSAADFAGHIHDSISNRNSFLPPSHNYGRHAQAASWAGCDRYSQRTVPSYRRTVLGTPHSEQAAPSGNNLQFHSESYSSRYSLSVGGWRSTHQDRRSSTAVDRFEPLSNAMNVHDQMDRMMVNPSLFYVSRDFIDQHRDMRLDIDNMSYEELLSLGERIGNVRTGLSNNVISKCLVKITYSTLDDKKEGPCVICQEEYSDMEEVAMIKNCGHDYHTGCITKWLFIKNACPICQGPAFANSPEG